MYILSILFLSSETHPHSPFPYLIIYVSPTKALCREVFTSWSQKFAPFGLQCIVLLYSSYDIHRRLQVIQKILLLV